MLVDKQTGEVLNDAQGYGFTSESKAYRGFLHNHRGYKIETSDKCKKENSEYYRQKANAKKEYEQMVEAGLFDGFID